jgi:hypothetical protein
MDALWRYPLLSKEIGAAFTKNGYGCSSSLSLIQSSIQGVLGSFETNSFLDKQERYSLLP